MIVLFPFRDAHSDTVVFGTTTDNLYLSEDRGENWRCLSNNLATIYSVRFTEE
ncbi:MAG: hypothetical protein IPK19_03050 [Chloroflexi bacterium]|nr:hypothetical protein [Chloroflexota bacterium]